MTLPRYLVAKGGTEFEAKPLPCTRLGDDDARCAPVFPWLPSLGGTQAVGRVVNTWHAYPLQLLCAISPFEEKCLLLISLICIGKP